MKSSKELTKQSLAEAEASSIYQKLQVANTWFDLVQIYLDGIDFCLSNGFSIKDHVRKHFTETMEQHNVYLDGFITLINPKQVVALGETSGTVKVDEYNVCQAYIKHSSKLKIKAVDHSFVMIDVFDDAGVEVEASGDAKVCVNRYGNSVVIFGEKDNARVKVVEKNEGLIDYNQIVTNIII